MVWDKSFFHCVVIFPTAYRDARVISVRQSACGRLVGRTPAFISRSPAYLHLCFPLSHPSHSLPDTGTCHPDTITTVCIHYHPSVPTNDNIMCCCAVYEPWSDYKLRDTLIFTDVSGRLRLSVNESKYNHGKTEINFDKTINVEGRSEGLSFISTFTIFFDVIY